jgi:asparagine synthase (glutamine-hydrolysing)
LQWYNNASLVQAAKNAGARSMVTGHWGDQILFQHSYLVDLFRRLRWKQVNQHLSEFGKWIGGDPSWFRSIFFRELIKGHIPKTLRPLIAGVRGRMQKPSKDQPWFSDDFRALAARSLSRYYPAKGKFPTVHSRSMYEEARAKYYVQAMELHNKAGAAAGVEMELPYLDRDLLSFLMRIPGEALTPGGVHRGLLRQSMKGILPKEIVERRSKANYTHLENEMMKRQYAEVSAFFADQSEIYGSGYVDASRLRETLESLGTHIGNGAGCATAWSLGDLVGLEIWLQEFFGQNHLN